MKIRILTLAACAALLPASAHGQTFDCDSATLMNVRGGWAEHDLNTVHADPSFPASGYPQVVQRIKAMSVLFTAAYPRPMGNEAIWYGYIGGNSYIPDGPLPYELDTFYLAYFCNDLTKQVERGGETGTWVYVYVNHFGGLFERFGDDWIVNGQPTTLFRRAPKIGNWKGLALLEPTVNHERSRAVVIGHEGYMPWKAVSQKEFLIGFRDQWQKQQAKAKARSSYANYAAERVQLADKLLREGAGASLAHPAIIAANKLPSEFLGEFSTEERGGTPVFRFPRGYFKKELPRDAPQFMVLYWRIGNNAASRDLMRQFEENFPIEKLAAMIDH